MCWYQTLLTSDRYEYLVGIIRKQIIPSCIIDIKIDISKRRI